MRHPPGVLPPKGRSKGCRIADGALPMARCGSPLYLFSANWTSFLTVIRSAARPILAGSLPNRQRRLSTRTTRGLAARAGRTGTPSSRPATMDAERAARVAFSPHPSSHKSPAKSPYETEGHRFESCLARCERPGDRREWLRGGGQASWPIGIGNKPSGDVRSGGQGEIGPDRPILRSDSTTNTWAHARRAILDPTRRTSGRGGPRVATPRGCGTRTGPACCRGSHWRGWGSRAALA